MRNKTTDRGGKGKSPRLFYSKRRHMRCVGCKCGRQLTCDGSAHKSGKNKGGSRRVRRMGLFCCLIMTLRRGGGNTVQAPGKKRRGKKRGRRVACSAVICERNKQFFLLLQKFQNYLWIFFVKNQLKEIKVFDSSNLVFKLHLLFIQFTVLYHAKQWQFYGYF